jgi:hypothetical protein
MKTKPMTNPDLLNDLLLWEAKYEAWKNGLPGRSWWAWDEYKYYWETPTENSRVYIEERFFDLPTYELAEFERMYRSWKWYWTNRHLISNY